MDGVFIGGGLDCRLGVAVEADLELETELDMMDVGTDIELGPDALLVINVVLDLGVDIDIDTGLEDTDIDIDIDIELAIGVELNIMKEL